MGTTNILDLNNRVDELEKSYPANKVMMSDGVTSVEEAVDELKANITSGPTALSFDTEYTASSDGYVRGIVNQGANKFVQIQLYFSSAGAYGIVAKVGDSLNEGQACSVYVRKGMKYKIQCSSTNDATCVFIPLS